MTNTDQHDQIRADFRDDLHHDRFPDADPDTVLRKAVRRYVTARESGIATERLYHEMRRAERRASGKDVA